MSHPGIRVLIKAGGKPRKILTVSEATSKTVKSRNDIYINIGHAEMFGDLPFKELGKEVLQRHFTIHGAEYRSEGNNFINFTTEFKDGTERRQAQQYTKAIQEGRYAPLYFRSYPDLRHKHYDVDVTSGKRHAVSIGQYDPSKSVLVLGVFVGPTNLRIPNADAADYSIRNLTMTAYNVVLMSSLIVPLASSPMGFVLNLFTQKNPHPNPAVQAGFDALMEGYDEAACKDYFFTMREVVRHEVCSRASDPNSILHTRFVPDSLSPDPTI